MNPDILERIGYNVFNMLFSKKGFQMKNDTKRENSFFSITVCSVPF